MQVKLGIVTISFNQKKYLDAAINSVNLQPPHLLDYIVVDPGSTDGSRELIQQRAQEGRLRYIFEKDQGPADGLNKGFAASDADVFGYLNSDDRFNPGALDYVANIFATDPHCDILLGGIHYIDAEGRRSRRVRTPDVFDLRRFAYGACNVWQQATFFRRKIFEAVGGFQQGNHTCWDSELVVDMVQHDAKIRYTSEILGQFRLHGESITGTGRVAQAYCEDMRRIRAKIIEKGVPAASRIEEAWLRLSYKLNPFRHASYLLAGRESR